MKHAALDDLQRVATVLREQPAPILTREERLQRWAYALERDPKQQLNTLQGTEYQPEEARAAMRVDDSPISVAASDPVLLAAGLQDDTYGEARRFFDLSDWQLHEIVCHCYHGTSMTAGAAAHRVRAAASGNRGMFARMRSAIAV
ncbi:MAG: hypothetical protein WD626_06665 [Bauldia sp.]